MNALTRMFRAGLAICSCAAALEAGLRAQAAPTPHLPRLTGTSFAVARYKAGSSASLYVASHIGAGMIVAGVVHQPRGNLQTIVIGSGTRARLSRSSAVTVILAGAIAPGGTSLRLYAMPRVTTGLATFSGIAAVYQPLGGRGVQQAIVDPLTVSVPVIFGARAGLTAMIATAERSRPDFGLGPSALVRVPGGAMTVELVARTRSSRLQLRSSFSAAL